MSDIPAGYTKEVWALEPASLYAALSETEAYLLHEAAMLRACGDDAQADRMERRAWACQRANLQINGGP